ncbi:probable cytochrome P450 304a1 [Aethina tumida]|uniref:probable cytochrome P450 304a1 n=1 Tax=Aethina tumida TaxID=116153 RepID=UPI00096B2764|nr:probable cytochrome P450 304a1 [Aethina tumida]
MITLLLYIVTILLIIYWLLSSTWKPEYFPPGPPRLPIWGSYWYLLKKDYYFPHKALESLGKQYDTDILGFYLGDFPAITTMNYRTCKRLLLKEEFNGRNDTIIIRERGLGAPRGIFFLDGPDWREQRRFTLRNLREFGFGRRSVNIENFVTDEIKGIMDLVTSNPPEEFKSFLPEKGVALSPELFYAPLLNSVMQVLASTKYETMKLINIAKAALRFQRSGDPTGSAISCTPWLRFIAPEFFGYNTAIRENRYILNFLQGVIDEHRKTFIPHDHRDLIDVYIQEQKDREEQGEVGSFTDEQFLIVILDCMFPAGIAIGHTLNFHFVNLINNPGVQVKMQEEIDRVVGRSRLPTLDDRPKMPYIEATIRESMRYVSLNPLGIPRRCTKDTIFEGYFIPKDTVVMPGVHLAHWDPKVWSQPDQYLPERFLDQDGNLLKKDLTLGFGAGKRLCVGETFSRQNMFLIIAGLLQNFSVQSANGKPIDLNNIITGVNLSIDNVYIRFIPRY